MNVIISADSGYPHKFTAGNVKAEFIIRGLQKAGAKVLFIDPLWGSEGVKKTIFGCTDTGINYITLPRKYGILSVIPNFFRLIKILKEQKQYNSFNIYIDAPLLAIINLVSYFACKLCGYKIAILSHEWNQSNLTGNKLHDLNLWANDSIVPRFVDYIHPISHFLNDKALKYNKKISFIPILGDFNPFVQTDNVQLYFAYCGSAAYFLRNTILIESFKQVLKVHNDVKFVLILSQLGTMKNTIIEVLKKNNIFDACELKTSVPARELMKIYANATGLLIPLNPNNIQDKSRFSQKIAEYLSCKRPIITSPVGEIPYYFQHTVNAIVVDYTAEAYAKGMVYLCENSDIATSIGFAGFSVGERSFNYEIEGNKLYEFYSNN